jgi:protein-arginine kinase activator protein McsA
MKFSTKPASDAKTRGAGAALIDEGLREQLRDAVAAEDFERAAKLRDQLKARP